MKVCNKCRIDKESECFWKDNSKKDGLCGICKECRKIYYKSWYTENETDVKEYQIKYRKENPEKIMLRGRKYRDKRGESLLKEKREQYHKNKEKINKKARLEYPENKEKIQARNKIYQQGHKEELKEYRRQYQKEKTENDPIYKLKRVVRGVIKDAFKRKGFKKTSKTAQILGCTFEELWLHLRYSFEQNYGIPLNWVDVKTLHIDHIVPLASAKTEEEVLKLNHYTNLQYLFAEDNMEKGSKLDWELKF